MCKCLILGFPMWEESVLTLVLTCSFSMVLFPKSNRLSVSLSYATCPVGLVLRRLITGCRPVTSQLLPQNPDSLPTTGSLRTCQHRNRCMGTCWHLRVAALVEVFGNKPHSYMNIVCCDRDENVFIWVKLQHSEEPPASHGTTQAVNHMCFYICEDFSAELQPLILTTYCPFLNFIQPVIRL